MADSFGLINSMPTSDSVSTKIFTTTTRLTTSWSTAFGPGRRRRPSICMDNWLGICEKLGVWLCAFSIFIPIIVRWSIWQQYLSWWCNYGSNGNGRNYYAIVDNGYVFNMRDSSLLVLNHARRDCSSHFNSHYDAIIAKHNLIFIWPSVLLEVTYQMLAI